MIPVTPWDRTTEEQRLACYRFFIRHKQTAHVNYSSHALGTVINE